MRLDPSNLQVESFETASSDAISDPIIWTGPGGPESYCYICYETGNTDPACQPKPIDPETRFYPCTQAHQQTCVGCA
jgi:hypothetical protein